tara:strand:- start:489 stop:620 length:132 start_codon:yes stop_codon:yes gene_type:complete
MIRNPNAIKLSPFFSFNVLFKNPAKFVPAMSLQLSNQAFGNTS